MHATSKESVEAAIAEVEARFRRNLQAGSPHVDERAFLEMLRQTDETARGHLDALAREPTDSQTLNALGLLCLSAGNRATARTLLCGAVLHGSQYAVPHANLAYVYLVDGHLSEARTLYERALCLDPELAIAHHGLADLLSKIGDLAGAEHHRSLGMQYHPITVRVHRGKGRPVRLLALGSAAFGNLATHAYFDDNVFAVASLVVEHYDPTVPLPPHDIVFNVIGDADLCAAPLAKAAAIVRRTDAPVINAPSAVAETGRATNAERLARLEGVVSPRIKPVSRTALNRPDVETLLSENGFCFPLLLRSPGHHGGGHFEKVNRAGDLAEAIVLLPGNELLVIEYLDVRDAAGDIRKYRVIIADGMIFPLHVAISRRWKVHYFSADMTDSVEHRLEDAAFLNDMHAVLGMRAVAALERIRDVLALDYGGIDFALDGAGNVVVFEANATMTVPLPELESRWDYRREPVARIHAAVRRMLVARAAVIGAAS